VWRTCYACMHFAFFGVYGVWRFLFPFFPLWNGKERIGGRDGFFSLVLMMMRAHDDEKKDEYQEITEQVFLTSLGREVNIIFLLLFLVVYFLPYIVIIEYSRSFLTASKCVFGLLLKV